MYEFALQPQNTSCVSLSNWDIKGISETPLQNFKASNIQYSPNSSTWWGREGKWLSSFFIKGQWEVVELSRRPFRVLGQIWVRCLSHLSEHFCIWYVLRKPRNLLLRHLSTFLFLTMNVSLHYLLAPMNTSPMLSLWHLLPLGLHRMFIQRVEVKFICDLAGGRPQNRKLMGESATVLAQELLWIWKEGYLHIYFPKLSMGLHQNWWLAKTSKMHSSFKAGTL